MRQYLLCLIAMIGTGVISAAAYAEEPRERADANRTSLWVDVYQGEPVPYEEVLEDLTTVRTIYLGERHTLQRHHEMQAKILNDLAQKGLPLALGLEQMESSQQSHLDRYNQGEIDFRILQEGIYSLRDGGKFICILVRGFLFSCQPNQVATNKPGDHGQRYGNKDAHKLSFDAAGNHNESDQSA